MNLKQDDKISQKYWSSGQAAKHIENMLLLKHPMHFKKILPCTVIYFLEMFDLDKRVARNSNNIRKIDTRVLDQLIVIAYLRYVSLFTEEGVLQFLIKHKVEGFEHLWNQPNLITKQA